MQANETDILKYGLLGAVLFGLIALMVIMIFSKMKKSRHSKKEEKMKQKEANQERKVDQERKVEPKKEVVKPKKIEVNPRPITFYKIQGEEGGEHKSFYIQDKLRIGRRKQDNDWTIVGDDTVSGMHCQIVGKEDGLYIEDCHSTNGTYVNKERILDSVKLQNHDKIRIGKHEYRIRC